MTCLRETCSISLYIMLHHISLCHVIVWELHLPDSECTLINYIITTILLGQWHVDDDTLNILNRLFNCGYYQSIKRLEAIISYLAEVSTYMRLNQVPQSHYKNVVLSVLRIYISLKSHILISYFPPTTIPLPSATFEPPLIRCSLTYTNTYLYQ